MPNLFDSATSLYQNKSGFGIGPAVIDDTCDGSMDWLGEVEAFQRKVGLPRKPSERLLTTLIEREIIPRLLLAHKMPPGETFPPQDVTVPDVNCDSEELTRRILGNEPVDRIVDQLQSLLDRGESLQRVYLELLAPIARRLGEYWHEDKCTFIDVTLALSRLHRVVREVGRRNAEGAFRPSSKRRIFLAGAPGEQHTFGLVMIEEFFLHAGWETASDAVSTKSSILEALSSHEVDVVGFSLACLERLDPLQEVIDLIGSGSSGRKCEIMVGGRLFRDCPGLAERMKGVTVVSDGVNAVEYAESLVSAPPRCMSVEKPD